MIIFCSACGLRWLSPVWAVLKFTRMGLIPGARRLKARGRPRPLAINCADTRHWRSCLAGGLCRIGVPTISLIRCPNGPKALTAGVGWIALACLCGLCQLEAMALFAGCAAIFLASITLSFN